MTFKEWMQENRPECIKDFLAGGVTGCPDDYGLETEEDSRDNCVIHGGNGCGYCWNREMPTKVTMVEQEIVEPAEGFKGPKGCPAGEPGEDGTNNGWHSVKECMPEDFADNIRELLNCDFVKVLAYTTAGRYKPFMRIRFKGDIPKRWFWLAEDHETPAFWMVLPELPGELKKQMD